MLSLYVSASRIDEFRKVVRASDEEHWLSEDKLVKQIREPQPLGWQARYGEALHALIERFHTLAPADQSMDTYTNRDGMTTTWPVEIVRACAEAWPKGCVFERRAIRDYYGPDWKVTIGGRVDATLGLTVVEGKTRFGYVTAQDYADSLQWRLYLAALPWAVCVTYRVHEIGGMYADKETGDLRIAKDGPVLKGIHEFRMWRQPGLREEVQEWVGRFVAWVQARDLASYLQPREAA